MFKYCVLFKCRSKCNTRTKFFCLSKELPCPKYHSFSIPSMPNDFKSEKIGNNGMIYYSVPL